LFLVGEIFLSKLRKSRFLWEAFQKEENISIYYKMFSFQSCKIEKLEKSGFGFEHTWSWCPKTTQHRFETV
jgi:hypothetical protein